MIELAHGTRPDSALSGTKFLIFSAAIVVLALLLREQFVLITQVQVPIRGDIRQYVAYAYNLVNSGTFSAIEPGGGNVVPDSFRGPGYPLFLSAAMLATGKSGQWYDLALQAQVALGAGTVLLTIALARHWLSRAASLGAGGLVAIWPHHIAATGALLSELLFGFVALLAAWLVAGSVRDNKPALAWAGGAAFGFAYLINPLSALFPPLAALALCKRHRQATLALLLVPALVAGGWALRNASLPDQTGPGRASINFVQGSWPNFHLASAFRFRDPMAATLLQTMDEESKLLTTKPAAGFARIGDRMREDPIYYARWYLLEKPYLLWDWDIRLGHGDVYFLEVERSPLDANPVLRAIKNLLRRLNFVIFLLSASAALVITIRFLRTSNDRVPSALVAGFCIYVTILHMVFQAEPRYSIAYRPFQMLMLVTALSIAVNWTRARFTTPSDT